MWRLSQGRLRENNQKTGLKIVKKAPFQKCRQCLTNVDNYGRVCYISIEKD